MRGSRRSDRILHEDEAIQIARISCAKPRRLQRGVRRPLVCARYRAAV